MKVICINGAKKWDDVVTDGTLYPIEGNIYSASQHLYYDDSYDLHEMPPDANGYRVGYRKQRFVPLSEIDEMELLEQRQEQLV